MERKASAERLRAKYHSAAVIKDLLAPLTLTIVVKQALPVLPNVLDGEHVSRT